MNRLGNHDWPLVKGMVHDKTERTSRLLSRLLPSGLLPETRAHGSCGRGIG
jgi:hypothetical protein